MERAQSVRAVSFGTICFLIAYVAPKFISIPLPWYLPLEREWIFTVKPATLGMGWYGLMMLAIAAGALGAAIAWLLPKKAGALSPTAGWTWTLVIAFGVLIVAGVYVRELVDRVPKPEPIPSWYVPR